MDRGTPSRGIRRMRFSDVLGRTERSELSQMEAAELLGVSERTFRRWRDRHRGEGSAGLADRRLLPSLRRAPAAEIERMLGLYRAALPGLHGAAFPRASDQAAQLHIGLPGDQAASAPCGPGGTGTDALGASQEAAAAPDGGDAAASGRLDARLAVGRGRQAGFVVTMEDATGALYSAFLVDQEGTASSLRGVREVVAKHGLSARSTPTAAAIISRRRRREAGCRRRF